MSTHTCMCMHISFLSRPQSNHNTMITSDTHMCLTSCSRFCLSCCMRDSNSCLRFFSASFHILSSNSILSLSFSSSSFSLLPCWLSCCSAASLQCEGITLTHVHTGVYIERLEQHSLTQNPRFSITQIPRQSF